MFVNKLKWISARVWVVTTYDSLNNARRPKVGFDAMTKPTAATAVRVVTQCPKVDVQLIQV